MNYFIKLIAGFGLIFAMAALAESIAQNALTPVGYWKTIDDTTGKPRGIVQLWTMPDKTLVGKIIKIYPRPGHSPNEACHACQGDKHNQPIVGMVFMEQLKQDQDNSNKWTDGKILDPQNGKTYHCNLLVTEQGKTLRVRGYIGLPLFGRSQEWHKLNSLTEA